MDAHATLPVPPDRPAPLSADECRALIVARHAALARGDARTALAARDALVLGTAPLLRHVVSRFRAARATDGRSCLPADDLIQEGYLAMIAAAEAYPDPCPSPWAAYAARAIKHRLIAANIEQVGAIRVPKDAARARRPRGFTEAGWEEIREAARRARDVAPLAAAGAEAARGEPAPECEAVEAAVARLPAPQAETVRLLYGIGVPGPLGRSEVARVTGVSEEAVSQRKRRALLSLARLAGLISLRGAGRPWRWDHEGREAG